MKLIPKRGTEMRLTKSFTADCLKENQKIIIYGAGRYGELALRGLQHLGLQPSYFADRTLAGTEYMGVKVISPNELGKFQEDVVLIASLNYFYEMLSIVQVSGNEYYDIFELIKLEYDESVLSEYALDEKKNEKKYLNIIENAGTKGIVLSHCEIVLTECCTLKCKDCANLMQYYQHPEKIDADEIIRDFRKFLDTIDLLLELRLLGGEPFIYKDINRVIEAFLNHEKIKRITIYTNSTVVPSEKMMECLKNDKIAVHMSDYGTASSKVEELKKAFEERGIQYYIHKYDKWYDLGGLEKRDYSNGIEKALYKNCLMAKCYTFYRGKFYLCPRAAHGERLGAFQNNPNEVADFTKDGLVIQEKMEELKRILENTESILACSYCDGCSSRSKEVDAAVQMNRVK